MGDDRSAGLQHGNSGDFIRCGADGTAQKATAGILWNQILPHHIMYIQEGHQGPIIYDFQDPNCPYCHVMYEHEAALIQAGKLTVRYVPVALAAQG